MEARERESVLADLVHTDEEVRRLAVERLTTFPPAEAITHLVESLGDASWRVRKAAIDRLAASPELSRAARALVDALADGENPGRRNAALETLVRTGAVAVPILLEATNGSDVDVRKQIVDVLAGIGDSQADPRLRELLRDEDANVRAASADAIGAVGVTDSTDELLACANDDEEPLVRLSCLRALARLEVSVEVADVSAALDDPLLRAAAIGALGNSEDPASFDTLTKALEASARSAREAAVEALLMQVARVGADEADRFGDRLRAAWNEPAGFLEYAEARLVDGPLSTRLALVQFLGLLRLPEAVAPLLSAGCDEAMAEVVLGVLEAFGSETEAQIDLCWSDLDPPARTLACQVMARTRGNAGDGRLRSSLTAPDPALRLAATRAVGSRGRVEILPDLVARMEGVVGSFDLDDEDETQVIADAIVEVAQAGGADAAEQAISAIAERLEGANEDFRFAATDVLGRVGRESDVPRIELLLSDPSDRVRRAATAALARVAPSMTEPLRLAMADESARVRIGAATALARSREPEVISDLAHLAEDEDPRVRAAAMRAVGTWAANSDADAPRERALSLLAIGLRKGGAVAMATLESLARIGGPGVVPLARSALDDVDPEIVQAALTCIGQHGSTEDLHETIGLFSHLSWAVRAQAVQVLSERHLVQAVPAMLRRLDVEQDEFVRSALLRALETLERQVG